jgi:hypothetical protein
MDDKSIERAGRKVAHLDLADHILSWDKKQARESIAVTQGVPDFSRDDDGRRYKTIPNPTARACPIDPSHGMLQIHGSGAQLMCCTVRPTVCDYTEPVSR